MMFHSLIQNKQFLVHMFAKQYFTCISCAAAGMYTEVLIKSVIKYLCSVVLTEDKIGPKMYVRHFCLCKSYKNCYKYEQYLPYHSFSKMRTGSVLSHSLISVFMYKVTALTMSTVVF